MKDKEFKALEKRLMDKCLEGKCPVCGSGIVKDFKDAIHDRVCQECLDDMKDFTNDFNQELPEWIIMDPEMVRKVLIVKHYKHDFPDQFEKLENDFLIKRDIVDNLLIQDHTEDYPVREYERSGHKVKAHERGEGTKEEKKYHQIEKVDKQTKEVKAWADKYDLEFEITHGEGNEMGDIRIDVSKDWRSAEIRIFPHGGEGVDISIWKEKGYHRSIKRFRDISLLHAYNYIKENFGLVKDFKDLDNKKIMKIYNKLKKEHPELSERELLKMVFSTISKNKKKIKKITHKK